MVEFDGQIAWVYCHDLKATAVFYENLLGLALWRRTDMARIYHTGHGGYIGVCRVFADRVVQPIGGMITLLTDDVDGHFTRLKSAGLPHLETPQERPEIGIYSFFCQDPNGYTIEIQRFLTPADHTDTDP